MNHGGDVSSLAIGKKLVYACIPTLCLLIVAELAVRLTGAAERCPTYRDSILWVCDPIVYFKPNPGQALDGRRLINRAGFRGSEFGPKRAGAYRIITLGDSCTFGVISSAIPGGFQYIAEPYPERLNHTLAERAGRGRFEVINGAVPGYNSYQGVMLLRTKLRGLAPDLITVRFGWNDHLMSPEQHIGNAFHEPATAVGRAIEDLLLRTALYPFSQRLGMELRLRLHASDVQSTPEFPKQWQPNVPREEYKHNLRRIAELAQARGAKVWFLTSPHAFLTDEYRGHEDRFPPNSPAQRMLVSNAIPSFERLIEIHEAYNAATREIGTALGVPVVDLEAIYRQHAAEDLFIAGDVLHPTQAGHDLEADALYDRLVAEGIVPPARGR